MTQDLAKGAGGRRQAHQRTAEQEEQILDHAAWWCTEPATPKRVATHSMITLVRVVSHLPEHCQATGCRRRQGMEDPQKQFACYQTPPKGLMFPAHTRGA